VVGIHYSLLSKAALTACKAHGLLQHHQQHRTELQATASSPPTAHLGSSRSPHVLTLLRFPPYVGPASEIRQPGTVAAPLQSYWCVSCLITLVRGKKHSVQAGFDITAIYISRWEPSSLAK